MIAAHSVVTRDIPPYAIAGGNPARVLRSRFEPEIVEALLDIAWWAWPEERLRSNVDRFMDVDAFVKKFR